MRKPSENKVLNGINAKEPGAFRQLFIMYYAPLKFFAKELIGKNLEDEMMENPFLKLYTEGHHFESFQSLQSFLYDEVIDVCRQQVQGNPTKFNLLAEKRINQDAEKYIIKAEALRLAVFMAGNGIKAVFVKSLAASS